MIFARAPELGRVKTRLAASVGEIAALRIYEQLVERTLSVTRGLRECLRVVAFTPTSAREEMQGWLGADVSYEAQRGGDLGERMANALDQSFEAGAERVLVIGTDSPDLSCAILEDAFRALDYADIVFGPALDGGYYLIGMREAHPELFTGVPWSTGDTLAQSLDAARRAGLSVRLLPELADIDTAEDWKRWLGGAL